MAREVLPEAEYEVAGVGPSKHTSFQGDKGPVEFEVTSVQLKGHEQLWVEVNSASDKPLPKVGDKMEGHVEQDDAGKYLPKFKKARKGGGGNWGGGGGQASPGAIWSARVQTAADLVTWYYTVTGKKPKDFDEVMSRVKSTAVDVNKIVDELVKVEELTKPAAPAAPVNNEAGETVAPVQPALTAQPDDIDEKELGSW